VANRFVIRCRVEGVAVLWPGINRQWAHELKDAETMDRAPALALASYLEACGFQPEVKRRG
jgi:hypothetical protein